MNHSTKAALLGIFLSGALEGLSLPLQPAASANQVVDTGNQTANAGNQSKNDKQDKHSCKGQNSCKGKGGCKSGDNGCKAKNACKGKGGCATETAPDKKKSTKNEQPGQEGGTPGARPEPKDHQ